MLFLLPVLCWFDPFRLKDGIGGDAVLLLVLSYVEFVFRFELYRDKLQDNLVGLVLDACPRSYVGEEAVSGFPLFKPGDGFRGVKFQQEATIA